MASFRVGMLLRLLPPNCHLLSVLPSSMHACWFAPCSFHFRLISNNRLRPPSDLRLFTDAFSRLTELQLNGTLMVWQTIMDVIMLMPRLNRLEAGYNHLQALTPLPPKHPVSAVTTINLDCNRLSNWVETFQALSPFQKCSNHLRLRASH